MPTRNEMKIDVFSDADWAGCPTTRKSTTGFVAQFAGATVHLGARTQSIVALSSLEPELSAIGIGAAEALHVRNVLLEACPQAKVTTRTHTDSSSGTSIATRTGSSKKAKHIELKHSCIQQLVQSGILSTRRLHVRSTSERARFEDISTVLVYMTSASQPHCNTARVSQALNGVTFACHTTLTRAI